MTRPGLFNRNWKTHITLTMMGLVLALSGLNILAPHPAAAADTSNGVCQVRQFFGLSPWYKYLGAELYSAGDKKCDVQCFNLLELPGDQTNACGQHNSDIPRVLLAVIDDLLRIAALAAVGFVIYAAFQLVGSQGDPDAAAKAQTTIINALIGLALAITSVAIISFLGKKFGGA